MLGTALGSYLVWRVARRLVRVRLAGLIVVAIGLGASRLADRTLRSAASPAALSRGERNVQRGLAPLIDRARRSVQRAVSGGTP